MPTIPDLPASPVISDSDQFPISQGTPGTTRWARVVDLLSHVTGGVLGFTPINKAGDTGIGALTSASDGVAFDSTGTGSIKTSRGTTAQRPDSGSTGSIRYNTTTGRLEFGVGSAWKNPVNLDGDTMTGLLTLSADPSSALHASTKQYTDADFTRKGVIRAATIAALRTVDATALTGNNMALVDGYTAAGDGGGGEFDWNPNVAATAPLAVTNSTTTITGIPAGTPLFFGMGVAGSGIPSNATIASIVSPTSITISVAATTSIPGGTPLTFNLVDDSCICIRPTGFTVQQPGRWIRRLNSKIVTLEMAGGKGDYVFPAAGAGEVTGTDNTTAFSRIANGTASLAFSQGNQTQGITIRLGPKCYRVASSISVPSGVCLEGTGAMVPAALVSGNTGPALFVAGSTIALEPTASITPINGAQMRNLRIYRRGLDLNPTYAQIVAFNAAMAQELAFNKHWLPATAYTAGDVVMNIGHVFMCTTSGTSAAVGTAGPEAMTTAADSIVDNTAKWQFLNQYTWNSSTAYVAGTIVCNVNRIYLCDTSGTSSSAIAGPTSTSVTVNGITDGTAKWHFLGTFSTGIAGSSPQCAYEELVIVGFAKGAVFVRSPTRMRNIFMDNFNCLDVRQGGDLVVFDRVHCLPLYSPTSGSIPDSAWRYKQAVCIFAHDRLDGGKFLNCEAENWLIGLYLSNVWQVHVTGFLAEAPGAYSNEACIKMRNICSFVSVEGCYTAGGVGYDIGATDAAHASTPNPAGQNASQIVIAEGRAGGVQSFSGPGGPSVTRIFKISGNSQGMITSCFATQFSGLWLEVMPSNGGAAFWNISNNRADGVLNSTLASVATIDSTSAANIHISDFWSASQNAWIVPPGRDDSIDALTPTTGGSHTIAASVGWLHMTPAGTIATYTITMPAAPLDNQEMLISTTQIITTFTLSANAGQTILGAPTTLAANSGVRFRYRGATTTWYKVST